MAVRTDRVIEAASGPRERCAVRTADGRRVAVTLLALLAGGCGEAPVPAPTPAPVPAAATPSASAATPPPARPFVYLTPVDGGAAGEVWLPETPPRALGVRVDFGGDSFGRGTVAPRLAPDGRRLAYRRGSELHVRHIDGDEDVTVVAHPPGTVELRNGGWAPDGGALLFHLAGFDDDASTLPTGVAAGFHVARLDGSPPVTVKGLPELPRTTVWAAGSDALLYVEARDTGAATLRRRPLDPAAKPALLFALTGEDGFTDLVPLGADEVVYVHAGSLVRSPLHGGGRTTLAGPGQPRQYARPRPSLDGTRIAFLDERALKVIAHGETVPTTVDECETLRCTYAWASDAALLVVDAGSLRRVDLDGVRTRIAEGVLAAAVAGE